MKLLAVELSFEQQKDDEYLLIFDELQPFVFYYSYDNIDFIQYNNQQIQLKDKITLIVQLFDFMERMNIGSMHYDSFESLISNYTYVLDVSQLFNNELEDTPFSLPKDLDYNYFQNINTTFIKYDNGLVQNIDNKDGMIFTPFIYINDITKLNFNYQQRLKDNDFDIMVTSIKDITPDMNLYYKNRLLFLNTEDVERIDNWYHAFNIEDVQHMISEQRYNFFQFRIGR